MVVGPRPLDGSASSSLCATTTEPVLASAWFEIAAPSAVPAFTVVRKTSVTTWPGTTGPTLTLMGSVDVTAPSLGCTDPGTSVVFGGTTSSRWTSGAVAVPRLRSVTNHSTTSPPCATPSAQ